MSQTQRRVRYKGVRHEGESDTKAQESDTKARESDTKARESDTKARESDTKARESDRQMLRYFKDWCDTSVCGTSLHHLCI